MSLIRIEHHGPVVVLELDRGVTNPLNLALVRELSEVIEGLGEEEEVGGVVLTSSSNKFFSIGFDLPELISLGREDFTTFYRAFNKLCMDLYKLAKPTIAAVTGHAVAGGCILVLCCDYRHIAEGHKLMGVNEVKLGVPVPYPGDCILRHLVDPRYSREILLKGDFYEPEESLKMGLVDRILPPDQLLALSIERARDLSALPEKAFEKTKRSRVEPVIAQIRSRLAEKEESFMELWFSKEARKLLERATEKF